MKQHPIYHYIYICIYIYIVYDYVYTYVSQCLWMFLLYIVYSHFVWPCPNLISSTSPPAAGAPAVCRRYGYGPVAGPLAAMGGQGTRPEILCHRWWKHVETLGLLIFINKRVCVLLASCFASPLTGDDGILVYHKPSPRPLYLFFAKGHIIAWNAMNNGKRSRIQQSTVGGFLFMVNDSEIGIDDVFGLG